jgi:hypothetical protein
VSTRNIDMPPRLRLAGSVTASTIAKSATGALWMKIFSPLSTHSSPSRRALLAGVDRSVV